MRVVAIKGAVYRAAGISSSAAGPKALPPRPLVTSIQRSAKMPSTVSKRLNELWQKQRLGAVADRELPRAIDAMMKFHVDIGFFGIRTDGMRNIEGFGPHGDVRVALAPNRTKVPIARDVDGQGSCGLCKPPFPSERGMAWRGWRIWPNAFPYVPTSSQHILLTSARHQPQGFAPSVLADMLDFQSFAGADRQLTMHYNGIAGNSQLHLHWQATREVTPLQTAIETGRLPLAPCVTAPNGRVETYDHGFFAGMLVSGSKTFVVQQATRIVKKLDQDPTTRGAYNLVLLEPRAGRFRLSIVARRADNLRPEIGSLGPRGIGAFNTAGVLVVPADELPDDFADAITPAMRATIVPPSELSWLADLSRESMVQLPGAIRARANPAVAA